MIKTIKTRFTLAKEQRLKSRKNIELLFKDGRSFSSVPFRVLFILKNSPEVSLQVGFAVSNKKFKRAVDRNRIKRLMRESYRLQKNSLAENLKSKSQALKIFIIYTANDVPVYLEIYNKMRVMIARLYEITNEAAATNI